MPRDSVERWTLWKIRRGRRRETSDWVVVEEPMEIRVDGQSLAVIMRTPGHDLELAAGFCLTEGVVRSIDDVGTIRQCDSEDGTTNVVEVSLSPGVAFDHQRMRRNLMASAACGLCGKASLEALAIQAAPVTSGLRVRRAGLESLPDRPAAAPEGLRRTRAPHAPGLFDPPGPPPLLP